MIHGEEIEIYYVGSKPYLKIKTNPRYMDSDHDSYSDYEEIKVLSTDPLKPNYALYSKDYLYVQNYSNFESGKAFDDYLDRSDFAIGSEYLFNVIVCGGEASINKMARYQLLDLFTNYANENVESISLSGYANMGNAFLRGAVDLISALGAGEQLVLNKQINAMEQIILKNRGVDNTRAMKAALKKAEKELQATLKKHAGKLETNSNVGLYGGLVLTFISCTSQEMEELHEYSASLEVIRNYSNILDELVKCNNTNVQEAARKVKEDMSGIYSKYGTCAGDYISNLTRCSLLAGASYWLADCSPWGLAAELVWLSSDIIVGDSLSYKITNFVCVDTAIGISRAVSNLTSGCSYISSSGKTYLVSYSDANYQLVQEMFRFDIYAKKWVESRYLGYLQSNRLFFDDDHFIKHDADSDIKAQNNIDTLNQLFFNY